MAESIDARDGVRREIQRSGLKQLVVAERAGLTEQQLCDIVKKRRKLDANELLSICTVLGIMPNDVFKSTQSGA